MNILLHWIHRVAPGRTSKQSIDRFRPKLPLCLWQQSRNDSSLNPGPASQISYLLVCSPVKQKYFPARVEASHSLIWQATISYEAVECETIFTRHNHYLPAKVFSVKHRSCRVALSGTVTAHIGLLKNLSSPTGPQFKAHDDVNSFAHGKSGCGLPRENGSVQ